MRSRAVINYTKNGIPMSTQSFYDDEKENDMKNMIERFIRLNKKHKIIIEYLDLKENGCQTSPNFEEKTILSTEEPLKSIIEELF